MHFKLTAEGLSSIYQSLMLSGPGKWRKAFDLLLDCVPGLTYSQIVELLEGETTFIEVEGGFDLVKQVNQEYQASLAYQRAGWCLIEDKVYAPEAILLVSNPDCLPASSLLGSIGPTKQQWFEEWYKNHSIDPSTVKVTPAPKEGICILWQPVGDTPLWFKVTKDSKAAIEGYEQVKTLPVITNKSSDSLDLSNQESVVSLVNKVEPSIKTTSFVEEVEPDYDALRTRILLQNTKNGGFLLELTTDHQILEVPSIPFLHWVWSREKVGPSLPEWQVICHSGLKMNNDCCYHSDWVIGSGLTPDEAYETEWVDLAYEKMFELQEEYREQTKGKPILLLAGRGKVEGKVYFPKPNERVFSGTIAVVPNASKDYEQALRSACKDGTGCLVTQVGGQLCHLAIVGREYGHRMVMYPKALEKLNEGDAVEVDLDQKIIKVIKRKLKD